MRNSKIISKLKISVALLLTGVILVGCGAGRNKTNVELIQDMMDQISLKAQNYDEKRGEASVRVPPEGTVPRGYTPEQYANDPLAAGRNLRNPLANNFSEDIISKGKKQYEIYCSVCHGAQGAGDGRIAEYMTIAIPSLLDSNSRNYSDGRLYHIITHGQGLMGAYAPQIFHAEDRWAVVNYIRKLQEKN